MNNQKNKAKDKYIMESINKISSSVQHLSKLLQNENADVYHLMDVTEDARRKLELLYRKER